MRKLVLALAFVFALVTAPAVQAIAISVFDNAFYVDTSGPTSSSDSLQALLTAQGNSVSTFTGLTAADFIAATGPAQLLVFPDLLNFGQLAGDLSAAAKAALAAYVTSGGGLIVTGESGNRLLNALFYPGACDFVTVFCLASTGSGGGSVRDNVVAAGTPYAAAPATLGPGQTGSINPFAFTPPGGLNLYRDLAGAPPGPNGTTVLTAPFGSGQFGYLAWGMGGATLGAAGGWDQVLDIMVEDLAEAAPAAAPAPGTLALLAPLVLLIGWRRRAAR